MLPRKFPLQFEIKNTIFQMDIVLMMLLVLKDYVVIDGGGLFRRPWVVVVFVSRISVEMLSKYCVLSPLLVSVSTWFVVVRFDTSEFPLGAIIAAPQSLLLSFRGEET